MGLDILIVFCVVVHYIIHSSSTESSEQLKKVKWDVNLQRNTVKVN